MRVTAKKDITDNKVTVLKGALGYVKALQWGDKGEKIVVDFEESKNSMIVNRDDCIITEEKIIPFQKQNKHYEGKRWKDVRDGKIEKEEEI